MMSCCGEFYDPFEWCEECFTKCPVCSRYEDWECKNCREESE